MLISFLAVAVPLQTRRQGLYKRRSKSVLAMNNEIDFLDSLLGTPGCVVDESCMFIAFRDLSVISSILLDSKGSVVDANVDEARYVTRICDYVM
jgi:hypothetical protein